MRKSVQGMLGTVCLIIPVFASLHVEAQQQCTDRLLAPDVKFNFSDTKAVPVRFESVGFPKAYG